MPIITKICERCGKEFSGPNFSMKKRKYCEHACYVAARTMDLTGQKFGRLTPVRRVDLKRWLSNCVCGGSAISATQNLISGKTQSCGCLNKERSAYLKLTHGATNTRAHNCWNNIIQRCTNPNYKQWNDYGGRGITVCDEWKNFSIFLEDMGQPPPRHSIERLDNNKGYSKSNCTWATRTQQQRNRRVVEKISYKGESKCVTEWAEEYGIEPALAFSRMHVRHWTFEEAMEISPRNTPTRERYIRSDARWITHEGRTMFLAEWCRELGLNSKSVHSRIARGATDLEALGLS